MDIIQALESSIFTKVIVDTDDEEIAAIAQKFRAEVPYMRPSFLGGDSVSTEAVILNSIATLQELGYVADTIVLLRQLVQLGPVRPWLVHNKFCFQAPTH